MPFYVSAQTQIILIKMAFLVAEIDRALSDVVSINTSIKLQLLLKQI